MKFNETNQSLGRTIFDFAVATFAVYRSTRMLNKEPGPHRLIDKIRNTIGPEEEKGVRGSFAEGVRCPYCTSIWMATITSCYYAATGHIPWTMVPVYIFSLSGSALGLILGYRRAEMSVLEAEREVEGKNETKVMERETDSEPEERKVVAFK